MKLFLYIIILFFLISCVSSESESEDFENFNPIEPEYNYQLYRDQFIADDGAIIKYRYYDGVKDRAVVLLHNSSRDMNYWTPLTYLFIDNGFDVITIDMRGYGSSYNTQQGEIIDSYSFEDSDYNMMGNDIKTIVQNIEETFTPFEYISIIGEGLGGNIALSISNSDKIKKVSILSPLKSFTYSSVETEELYLNSIEYMIILEREFDLDENINLPQLDNINIYYTNTSFTGIDILIQHSTTLYNLLNFLEI